jgi:hypothetical protein
LNRENLNFAVALAYRGKREKQMTNQEQPPVYAITSASTGLSFDQAGRKRRYLISMSLRTICFVGAVFASGNLRWALIFGAIFLPYIAVVIANAGRENFFFNGKPVESPTRTIESGPTQ